MQKGGCKNEIQNLVLIFGGGAGAVFCFNQTDKWFSRNYNEFCFGFSFKPSD
jgi:hypothetical protein